MSTDRLEKARENLTHQLRRWDDLVGEQTAAAVASSGVPVTVTYKGQDWPVSPAWAEKHLAGRFAELATWETGSERDSASPVGLWGRLWAILRKSDETLTERTAGLSHADIAELMKDPDRSRAILDTLTTEELRELRAVEAHIIIRRRADFLLGRELSEFDIAYIDHAHGQGSVPACGCDLLSVLDDDKLARTHAGEEGLKCAHAHFPRRLCDRHAHLQSVVAGSGRWNNQPIAERLEQVREAIFADQVEVGEAQPDAVAA